MKLFFFIYYALAFLATPFAAAKKKVNVQWAICDSSPQEVLRKLGMGTPDPYKQNPITYYDTEPPTYISNGIMFRKKTSKGQKISTVKVRFHEKPSEVPDWAECVWDRYGENATFTCEKRCPLPEDGSSIWCNEQIKLAERYQCINWTELTAFGPYDNAKWKIRIEGHKAKFDDVAAGPLHLMEVEAKVPPKKEQKAYEAITRHLTSRGVVLCDRQEGKTQRLFRALGYRVDVDERDEL
ncbi:uncharacterized protein BDW43DRAFT_285848 [Aspergillus alliaceus]|uniref:uncharacterized protein n=1 Tax=Petromyces alliaceus TaxID=209559 RepID=UPI0012A5DCF9|nr:uncharacterized protein BDW43DRAFT_285848 [Aspergillus alliaceus]KAB8230379.1 hypothetical protein BDW43DRAFT_285848 [Aspergillus alliaceus]